MIFARPLDVRELLDRRLLEPWKLAERDEQFFVIEQQPEPMPGHVRELSYQGVCLSDGSPAALRCHALLQGFLRNHVDALALCLSHDGQPLVQFRRDAEVELA